MHGLLLLASFLGGCCPGQVPEWTEAEAVSLAADARVGLDVTAWLASPAEGLSFEAVAGSGVLAEISADGKLALVAESAFKGETSVTVTATDGCGNASSIEVQVTVGGFAGQCAVTLNYTARGDADQVFAAGVFNDWNATATPMVRGDDGRWTVTLELSPGAYPYKFVEADAGSGSQQWSCDPEAELVQCDEGYTWDPSCGLGAASCNSLLVVEDCSLPAVALGEFAIDEENDAFALELEVTGQGAVPAARLDGAEVALRDLGGGRWALDASGLADGRHTVDVSVTDADGRTGEPLYVPIWLDDFSWDRALMYYVFVDRFANGDPSRDTSEGTTHASTDYLGGDFQGVIDQLDYLQELGVNVLWLTNPQDNPPGAWGATCGATYSGYHGYWPASAFGIEEHFGDEATLRRLIDEAHARNMRVLTDWVGNHLHLDHPLVSEHPEWFNEQRLCGDANNWNDIPEQCWFDSFLPDIRYYDPEPLVTFVDDAVQWVKEYRLDGYRVDAVKHMPHSVFFNFNSRARAEIEHAHAGGVVDFYTVGETYSGDRNLIMAYVSPEELDGQFDFPLYWAITAAFAREEIGLSNGDGSLESVWDASVDSFQGALMSTFLGNHDVARFIAQASGEIGSLYGDSACGSDTPLRTPDTAPGWDEPYRRLMLGWSFLLTSEGLPLVYYGDEIGLPGYNDPDNRQMMRFADDLSADEATVLDHVRRLGKARRAHPSLAVGTRTPWWQGEAGFWAYARVYEDDASLILLNRDDSERTVTNGLSFAGLPEGVYQDVLTGDRFTSVGDSLTVWVPALGSRVLVRE